MAKKYVEAPPIARTAPSNKQRLEIGSDQVLLMFVMVGVLVLY